MYESHFGFDSRPFAATPDAARFFPTENTKRSFESIVACVQRATGAALVVGGSGLGKSVLLKAIGRHFQSEFSVAVLESASLQSRKELLQNILFELGLPFHGMEEGELRLTLMDYLKPSERCPNGLLLCVDEAHLLSSSLLEEMRMITNLVRDGQPRARLVLAGNPSIEERMAEPQLESLSQRISTRVYLESMNSTECRKYMTDCLRHVGSEVEDIFDDDAIEAVFIATHGIPRLINQVCDHALVLAVADGKTRIDQSLINEAWSDIQRLPVDWNVLGTQTEHKNEHVIEFGELEGEPQSNDDVISESSSSSVEVERIRRDEDALDADSSEVESEEVEPPFVFEGPRDPFADEEFTEEEKVVDRFSQLIGHTPIKPSFPVNESTNDEKADESESDTLGNQTDVYYDTVQSSEDIEQSSDGTDVESVVLEKSESSIEEPVASDSEDTATEIPTRTDALNEYLANTREAITFGVGQGIDTETEVEAELESITERKETADTTGELESNESSDADSDSHEQVAAIDRLEAEQQVEEEFTVESTVSIPDASDANLQAMENEINRAVEELQQGIDDAVSTTEDVAIEVEDSSANQPDDRDMIVVEEEKTSGSNADTTANTVPMHETESPQNSTQAKREDYRQLFDRLRNG